MSVFDLSYSIFIEPLEILFETVFTLANRVCQNPGLSILILSLTMNFLLTPLYHITDQIQQKQNDKMKKMRGGIAHIRQTFHGDERFFMMRTFYRQNHYHPLHAVKGMASLLLEIPFFIAAYHFLSGLAMLENISFGPIQNLAAPDTLISIDGFTIHVLPILMTAINLISAICYTREMPASNKIQLYGMAGIFLVLLYDSPSGLVLYWTCNNLFSLIRNLNAGEKRQTSAFPMAAVYLSAVGILILADSFFDIWIDSHTRLILNLSVAAMQIPLVFSPVYLKWKQNRIPEKSYSRSEKWISFLAGCGYLMILTGILIPSAVISASPQDFMEAAGVENPLVFLKNSVCLALGCFMVWVPLFRIFSPPSKREKMDLGIWLFCGIGTMNYLFFGTHYGILLPNLQYEIYPTLVMKDVLLNVGAMAVFAIFLCVIWVKKPKAIGSVYLIFGLAVIGMSVVNIMNASGETSISARKTDYHYSDNHRVEIPMSKDGKNVVVLMLDRAINRFVPCIMDEKPELLDKFSGFTYYPNTISYGGSTVFGSPGLFGGYEYTPEAINRRDSVTLTDKQNEALRVMPVNFYNAGYQVSVGTPPLAGYQIIPDLSIYEDYPEINTFNTHNMFLHQEETGAENRKDALHRNFFCFALYKMAPLLVQPALYGMGTYNKADALFAVYKSAGDAEVPVAISMSEGKGMGYYYKPNMLILRNFPRMTRILDSNQNTFTMISNNGPHSPTLLKEPEYAVQSDIDNREYDRTHMERFTDNGMKMDSYLQMSHYHANMGCFLEVAAWLDYLRENNLYDNTKIIIVSDHGYSLGMMENWILGDDVMEDIMSYNPLLMVKDFNSHEFTVDSTFMTNADVPTIAFRDLLDGPVNPATGNPITDMDKQKPVQHIIACPQPDQAAQPRTQFLKSDWLELTNHNIDDPANWKVIPEFTH